MPDQSAVDPETSDGRQASDAGQSFAEANRRLAERQQAESEGAGDLPESDTFKAAPGQEANAPTGPGLGDSPGQRPGPAPAATEWTTEERLAAEQWLRRIPDDPGGLLRRKFLFQYRERQRAMDGNRQPPR
jgi:Ca-activated chloride channel family protein